MARACREGNASAARAETVSCWRREPAEAGGARFPAERGVGGRHHVFACWREMDVFGCDYGRIFASDCWVVNGEDADDSADANGAPPRDEDPADDSWRCFSHGQRNRISWIGLSGAAQKVGDPAEREPPRILHGQCAHGIVLP